MNNQGLKQCNRHSSSLANTEQYVQEEQEKVAHTMKVFRILCLIIHNQVPGLPTLVKENAMLPNCLQAIAKVGERHTTIKKEGFFSFDFSIEMIQISSVKGVISSTTLHSNTFS